ncbi:hypothetical protein ANO11243_039250 [Dothideomycetidae sp. 11243]|nr:hypothetical protein ANO11243_039250 [fungal sp. No.11243]
MPSFEGDDGDEEAHLGSPRLNSTNSSKGFVDAMPHRWPLTGPIKADSTALIVLDMQRDFCEQGGLLAQSGHPIAAARSIIPPILRLLHASRVVGLPVYHVRHSHRHDLSTFSANERARQTSLLELPPMPRMESSCDPHSRPLGHFLLRQSPGTDPVVELCPLYHEVLIDHSKPSAFAYTDLDLLLRNRDIRNLIIVGLDVNDSLVATVRDAAEKRYDCLLVQGCIASVSSIVPLSSGQHLEQGVTVDLSLFEQAASAHCKKRSEISPQLFRPRPTSINPTNPHTCLNQR